MKPGIPRSKPICRPFYRLMKYGFPTSLSTKTLPRCKVGTGKRAAIYMWRNAAACRFLGGRLIRQRKRICKTGKPHTWKRVVRCIKGPVITNRGFNYKKGGRYVPAIKRIYISGKSYGNCGGWFKRTNAKRNGKYVWINHKSKRFMFF